MSTIFRYVFPLLRFFDLDRPNGNWRDVQEDAGQNASLLRHKMKGKSRMMNQNQAKEYYEKMFVNYPDVLSVEEATTYSVSKARLPSSEESINIEFAA